MHQANRLQRVDDRSTHPQPSPPPRVADLAAEQATRSFVGRRDELSLLLHMLDDSGPAVTYVHGIAGIGKSRLLSAFAQRAASQGASVIVLDCRAVEPTESGFLRALATRFGTQFTSSADAIRIMTVSGLWLVIALDHYESLHLLDAWLRQSFVPQLPRAVRLLIADRQPPVQAWPATPGWQRLFRALELDALPATDASSLLNLFGIPEARAARINRLAQGHPLALTLAASSLSTRDDVALDDLAIHRVIHELTTMYLSDITDPTTRSALEASCVLRRATVSLLRMLLPDIPPQDAFSRLRALPFVHIDADGLHIHDSVKQVLATTLRSADPTRYREFRRAAWMQLRKELATATPGDLWRYTADMLYLMENPVVRDAFFPTGVPAHFVEPARTQDFAAVREVWTEHEGPSAARALEAWWSTLPQSFSAVRDQNGKLAGFYCMSELSAVTDSLVKHDRVVRVALDHLETNPLAKNETVLIIRRWLSAEDGEQPCAVQAACWLDIKRTYLALRPRLRRVYLAVRDIERYGDVAHTLGFVPVPTVVEADGHQYHTVMLDFGPASVDGWFARLADAELGTTTDILDVDARELVLDDRRVPLTPLEFSVFRYLRERSGKAVPRETLIRDVWGLKYDVGSNVVDVVIRTLRKKLGNRSHWIETVPAIGYKLRNTDLP
jgi:Transcriptional regulatory protein, C terminal/AAA ATPase domain